MKFYEKTREYYSVGADDYVRKRNKSLTGEFFSIREWFVKELGSGRVLDVGCAHGIHSKFFVERGLSVVGVDFSGELIGKARESVPGAEFFVMDMRDMSFEKDSFDGVWACASLLHLNDGDCKRVVDKLYSFLRKDGLFFACVKKGAGEEFDGRRYVNYFQPDEFRGLIENSGFRVLDFFVNKHYDANVEWVNVFARK